jgi:predicted metal-dependent phosphoesterase TrpH
VVGVVHLEPAARVRAPGGVTVFAHPAASARGRVVGDEVVEELAAAGLDGLEVDHADHTPDARAHLRELAAAHGLLVTGSSDFHGTNKSAVLGAEVTAPAVYEELVGRATGAGVL